MTQIEHHVYGNAILSTWRADLEYWTETTNTAVTIECWPGDDSDYYSAQTEGTSRAIATGVIGNMSNTITVTCTGQTTKTKTVKNDFIADGDWTWTWTIARTHSAQTVTLGISNKMTNYIFIRDADYSETRTDTSSGTGTFTIPAKPSYTVSYNANGGSGAPGNQTKWYGETLTLSSTKPTRSGWTFVGWNTSSSATTATYQPGWSYTGNAALTLYAIWKKTITVTYNANGGSSAPASQSVTIYNSASSGNITLTTNKPSRTNFEFVSWNTNSSGTGNTRNGGTSYSFSANTTLYAIWDAVPSISSLTAVRCDENGDPADEGEYALITCEWFIDGELGDTATLTGTVTPQTGGNASSFTFSSDASGSGSKTAIALIGQGNGGALDVDMQYTVSVTAANGSRTTSRNVILTRAFFVMDWKAGGTGVGIGRAAPSSGLEIGFATTFDEPVTFVNGPNKVVDNSFAIQSSSATRGTVPSSTIYTKPLKFIDSNGNALGYVDSSVLASTASTCTRLVAFNTSSADPTQDVWNTFNIYVKPDGTQTYSMSSPANFRSAINAVNKGGDTMTGDLVIDGGTANKYLYVDSTTIDIDTAPSSQLYATTLICRDKNNNVIGHEEWFQSTSKEIGHQFANVRQKVNGTWTWYQNYFKVSQTGTVTYGLYSPTAFRNALGASSGIFPASVGGTGSAYYDTSPPSDVNGSNVSVANNTNTTIATMTITSPGKYIVHAGFNFTSNATGRRVCGLTFDDTTGLGARTQTWSAQAVNGYGTMISMVRVVNTTGTSYKIRANVYQNSGAALNCACYMHAFRLK